MCEPTTSYPCSCSRHAATEESTPPDIATSTDGMAARLPCAAGDPHVSWPRDRGAVRRPHGRRAELPAGGAGRRAGSTPARRGARRARGGRAGRRARPVGRGVRRLRGRSAASTPRSRVRAADPADPFADAPARVVRDVRGPRGDGPARSRPRIAPTHRPARVATVDDPRRLRRGDRADPRAHRRRRHVPGQPHAARSRRRSTATPAACTATSASRSAARTAPTSTPGRYRVLSASPELFFRIDGDRIMTRADEGHRAARSMARRGRGDPRTARGLGEGSGRERDDRGSAPQRHRARSRAAAPSRGRDVFAAERYETVWQLTSTRRPPTSARMRRFADVFRALFPCGSVTGAPEGRPRCGSSRPRDAAAGVYCGTVGYLAPAGAPGPRARFNVAIRTVVAGRRRPGPPRYGVGGGITWDSRAAAEYDETVAKARVLTARRPPLPAARDARARSPGRGSDASSEHLAGSAPRPRTSAPRSTSGVIRDALEREAARFPTKPARVRLVIDRRGPGRDGRGAARRHPRAGPAGDRPMPTRSTPPTRCCSTRRPPRERYDARRGALPRRRRRRPREHARARSPRPRARTSRYGSTAGG